MLLIANKKVKIVMRNQIKMLFWTNAYNVYRAMLTFSDHITSLSKASNYYHICQLRCIRSGFISISQLHVPLLVHYRSLQT